MPKKLIDNKICDTFISFKEFDSHVQELLNSEAARGEPKELDQYIFTKGKQSDFVYIIQTGHVVIYVQYEGGKCQWLSLCKHGDILGEFEIYENVLLNLATAKALDDVSYWMLKKSVLVEALTMDKKVGRWLFKQMLRKLNNNRIQLERRKILKLEEIMICCLKELIEFMDIEGNIIPICRQDFAAFAGYGKGYVISKNVACCNILPNYIEITNRAYIFDRFNEIIMNNPPLETLY